MIYVTQQKLHAKKEEKLLKRFWDRPLPPQYWRTDGRMDRLTTDKSVLENLRCLSAGGAKKLSGRFWENNILSEKLTTDESALEKLRCLPAGGAKKLTKR